MRADPERSPTKQAKNQKPGGPNGAEVQNHNPERENQTKPGRRQNNRNPTKNRQIQITDRMSLRQAEEARTGGRKK